MDEARVASVHELQLETPIELTRLRRQRTLEIDYELVQQRFVHSIVKEPSKVLVICRAGRIEGIPLSIHPEILKRGSGVGEAVATSPATAIVARQSASEKMKSCLMV